MSLLQIVLVASFSISLMLIVVTHLLRPRDSKERRNISFKQGYHGSKYVGSQYDNGQDMRSIQAVETERKFFPRKGK